MFEAEHQDHIVTPLADSPSIARAQGMVQALRWQQTNALDPQEAQRVRDAIARLTAFIGSAKPNLPMLHDQPG